MVERRYGARLALEAIAEPIVDDLDRHRAAQSCVAGLVHLSHAARAEQCFYLVRAKLRAGGDVGHGGIK